MRPIVLPLLAAVSAPFVSRRFLVDHGFGRSSRSPQEPPSASEHVRSPGAQVCSESASLRQATGRADAADSSLRWLPLLEDATLDALSAGAACFPLCSFALSRCASAAALLSPVLEAMRSAAATASGWAPGAESASAALARSVPSGWQAQAEEALEVFLASHPEHRVLLEGLSPVQVALQFAGLLTLSLGLLACELSGCWRLLRGTFKACSRRRSLAPTSVDESQGGAASDVTLLHQRLAELEQECSRLRAAAACEAKRIAVSAAGGAPPARAAPAVARPSCEEVSEARGGLLEASARLRDAVAREDDTEPPLTQRLPRQADSTPEDGAVPRPETRPASAPTESEPEPDRRGRTADGDGREGSTKRAAAAPLEPTTQALPGAGPTTTTLPCTTADLPPSLCTSATLPDTAATLPATTGVPRRRRRSSVYTNDVPADVVATVVDVPFMVGEVVEVLKDDGETWVDAKVETTFTTDAIDVVDGQAYTILRGTIKVSCELGTKYVMADDVGFTLRKKIEDSTLPKLPGHLQVVQQLGEGAYGEVFLCQDDRDGSQVAVKWVREFTRDPLFGKRVLREIRILAAMDHPNLLQLIDVLPVPRPDFDDVYFVMPYMHCDLHKVIYSKAVLSESHSQAFTCQILRGLKYLHSAGVVHRDLKPGNILVNRDCTLRVADLGLARGRAHEEEELTDYVVTRWYRAPELMLLPSGYFEAIDLWSVGCIHVELHTRRPLFPGENHVSMLRSIAKTLGFNQERDLGWLPTEGKAREGALNFVSALCLPESPTRPLEERMPQASRPCLEFVRRLLAFDPNGRLSAADALSHEYLERLRDPMAEVTATRPFAWDFDRFDATERALKDRVYAECARHHPEILSRDAEIIAQRGMAPMLNAYSGTKGCVTPPARAPRKRSRTPGASGRS